MFDYIIENAKIIDGSGHPAYFGNLAISDGKIAAVGMFQAADAVHRINAAGRYLTPGLIDIHRHGDGAMFRPGYGAAELYQGITTVVHGNCGLSMAPVSGPYTEAFHTYLLPITGPVPAGCPTNSMKSFLDAARQTPSPIHNGMLAGMGTLRACVAGLEDVKLSKKQYQELHAAMEQALYDGALGFSLGLGYAPECFYSTEGLVKALEPLKGTNVPVTVHMRQEGDGVVEALSEMLRIAKELDLYLEVSHLKAIGKKNWGHVVPQMLQMIGAARAEGVRVACDVYPYPAGSTQLVHTLPTEYQMDAAELTQALKHQEIREKIKERIETGTDFENIIHLVGFENVCATGLRREENRDLEGKSIAEIAELWHRNPYDALFDLMISENCAVTMIDFIAAEDDIDQILKAPFSSVISDATYPTEGLCHPRVYGSCARILETYVQKRKVIGLEDAIRKMTSLPAERLNLKSKGRILPGADADLCLFHLNHIHENGIWTKPDRVADGMDWVFVAGKPAIAEGIDMKNKYGSVLTRN